MCKQTLPHRACAARCALQKEGKDVHVCAKEVSACAGLRTAYYQCKRGQIDARNRIVGNRYQ